MKLCKCGCGNEITVKLRHKYHGIPDYIQGHSRRKNPIPIAKYCECGCGQLAKPGNRFIKDHGRRGIKCTKRQRKNISDGHKGQVAWNKGKNDIYSEEALKKMGDGRRGKIPWNKGLTKETDPRVKQYGKSSGESRRGVSLSDNHVKKIKESLPRGLDHWAWKEGSSNLSRHYVRSFTNELKELIRIRDNYRCQLCGMPESENIRKLDIHHIDYKRKNCLPSNLISLCRSCHMKTNKNRDKYQKYFSDKVKNQRKKITLIKSVEEIKDAFA